MICAVCGECPPNWCVHMDGPEPTPDQKRIGVLSDACADALKELEMRCGVTGCKKQRTWKRTKVLLVGKPNQWCDEHVNSEHGPSLPWQAEKDDYQRPVVAILREALLPSSNSAEKK